MQTFKIMKMEQPGNTGKIIGALLLGAVIGGALGILFAPAKGTRTRRKIAGTSDDLSEAVKEKFNDFLEEIEKEVETVKVKAHKFMGNGTAKAKKIK